MGKFFDNFMSLLVTRTFMRISMVALLLGSFFFPYTAHASSHDQGVPPFPYLVVGTVQVDCSFISESSSIKYENALAIPQFAIKSGKPLVLLSALLDPGPKKIS